MSRRTSLLGATGGFDLGVPFGQPNKAKLLAMSTLQNKASDRVFYSGQGRRRVNQPFLSLEAGQRVRPSPNRTSTARPSLGSLENGPEVLAPAHASVAAASPKGTRPTFQLVEKRKLNRPEPSTANTPLAAKSCCLGTKELGLYR